MLGTFVADPHCRRRSKSIHSEPVPEGKSRPRRSFRQNRIVGLRGLPDGGEIAANVGVLNESLSEINATESDNPPMTQPLIAICVRVEVSEFRLFPPTYRPPIF